MIGIIPQKQQTSFGDKSSQEKKDLEEQKKRLNDLSLALDNKNKDLEEKQKDIVNKEKDLKQREENIQTEEQELNQRETDLNNNSSSNIPDVFFLMDRDLENLPFELPMDWVHRENMWVSYLIGNETKPNLHSFLKCALPKSDENDYESIIKEEYMQKIYEIFSNCLYFFRSNMYSSGFEYKKNKHSSSDFYYSDFLFQQPFLFMFCPAIRYRIEFLDNAKTIKCYLKFCLDLPLGQEETAPKFGFAISQIIFNKSDTYNDFKNLLKNETFKDEYKDIIFIN